MLQVLTQGDTAAERQRALKALADACKRDSGNQARAAFLAEALVRLGAFTHLVATLGDPTEEPVVAAVSEEALRALTGVIDALSSAPCVCCKHGSTRAVANAVAQLLRCDGLARIAALMCSRNTFVACRALPCACVLLTSVDYRLFSRHLDLLTTQRCLERALYLAVGAHPCVITERTGSLHFLCAAIENADGAAARLAAVPGAAALLLLMLEPTIEAKRAEMFFPAEGLRERTPFAHGRAAHVLALVLRGAESPILTPEFVQPLIVNALHILLSMPALEEMCDMNAAHLVVSAAQPGVLPEPPRLARLVPFAMLRALCARTAGAAVDTVRGKALLAMVRALARCDDENAALLLALTPPAERHRLGDDLPDPMSAEQLAKLQRAQRRAEAGESGARAAAADAQKTNADVFEAGQAAANRLAAAAEEATCADARIALMRAAIYTRWCARAPLVDTGKRAQESEISTSRRSFVVRLATSDEAEDESVVALTNGIAQLTRNTAPDFRVMVETHLGASLDVAQSLAIRVALMAGDAALMREAARWGCGAVIFGSRGALPMYDAGGAFVLTAYEVAKISGSERRVDDSADARKEHDALAECLTRLTWRFKAKPGTDGERFNCSLAATLAAVAPEDAKHVRAVLGASLAPSRLPPRGPFELAQGKPRLAPKSCADCDFCVVRRAAGVACALPACNATAKEGAVLKLCARCTRVKYCCREVRACALRDSRARTCLRTCSARLYTAPNDRLEAPQEGVPQQPRQSRPDRQR